MRWQGERLPRLLDARHAALQNHAASLLVHWGWLVRPEVSFNHFGDRGRVDLVAYHEPTRTAAMVEVKPALGDIQDTLGRLDVKARLGRRIALSVGWPAAIVIPMLILGEGSTQRRQVRMHEALFSGFVTGRAAMTWLRQPAAPHPAALLVFATADSPHADRVGSVVLPADGGGRW